MGGDYRSVHERRPDPREIRLTARASAPTRDIPEPRRVCHAAKEALDFGKNGPIGPIRTRPMDPNTLVIAVVIVLALAVGAVIGSRLRRK